MNAEQQTIQDTTEKVLTRARQKVAAGWIQRQERDSNGNVCSIGAINWAVRQVSCGLFEHGWPYRWETGEMMTAAAQHVLLQAIRDVFPNQTWGNDIACWNDYPGRTQEEVLHTFDHAIKLAAM